VGDIYFQDNGTGKCRKQTAGIAGICVGTVTAVTQGVGRATIWGFIQYLFSILKDVINL
jgi:hypothetical protein